MADYEYCFMVSKRWAQRKFRETNDFLIFFPSGTNFKTDCMTCSRTNSTINFTTEIDFFN